MHSWLVNGTQASLDFRERGPTELGTSSEMAVQPVFYDYYGGGTGEVGESESTSGQNRLHQPQEVILFFFVLAFFCNGILV